MGGILGYQGIVRSKLHFDILNRFGVAHECDGRTDRETDGIAMAKCVHLMMRAKNYLTLVHTPLTQGLIVIKLKANIFTCTPPRCKDVFAVPCLQ